LVDHPPGHLRGALNVVLGAASDVSKDDLVLVGANFVAIRFSNHEPASFWGAVTRNAQAAILAVRRIAFPRGPALAGAQLLDIAAFFALS
jgi:hypothetical protein